MAGLQKILPVRVAQKLHCTGRCNSLTPLGRVYENCVGQNHMVSALSMRSLLRELHAAEEGLEAEVAAQGAEQGLN